MEHFENKELTFKEENNINFNQRPKRNKNMQFGADVVIYMPKVNSDTHDFNHSNYIDYLIKCTYISGVTSQNDI